MTVPIGLKLQWNSSKQVSPAVLNDEFVETLLTEIDKAMKDGLQFIRIEIPSNDSIVNNIGQIILPLHNLRYNVSFKFRPHNAFRWELKEAYILKIKWDKSIVKQDEKTSRKFCNIL